jgi:hypothetical protein
MNEFEPTPGSSGESAESGRRRKFASMQHRPPVTNNGDRLAELETENARLHRLVAELLIKNQQLRKTG